MKLTIGNQNRGGEAEPAGCGGRVFGTLFFGVFFVLGMVFCVLLLHEAVRKGGTFFWRATPCRILNSEIVPTADEAKPYLLKIEYEYEAGGSARRGERVTIKDEARASYSELEELRRRFPAGSEAVCYIKRGDPETAVLVREIPWLVLFIAIPLVFVAIGFIGIVSCWQKPGGKVKPISGEAVVRPSWKLGIVFWGFLLIVGLVSGQFLLFRPLGNLFAAQSWVETPCLVESSQVRQHSGSDNTTYSIEILYRYEFGGEIYWSDRYMFIGGSSSGYKGKRDVVRRYPVGSSAVCYVNPDEPWRAVLNRKLTPIYLLGLIPVVVLMVATWGLWHTFRVTGRGRTSSKSETRISNQFPIAGILNDQNESNRSFGPVVLKPASSPVGRLIGMTFFAVFWNGIVSVFIYACATGWMKGDGSWLLTIFLVPFVLVGLGVIWGIFYYIMALFNPRPTVTIESARIPLGCAAWVEWRISGNVQRIGKLTLTLEAHEEATYRRGTDTHTDKGLFHREVLFETRQRQEMAFGKIEAKIPERTMHTLDARNNKIIWRLKMDGEIERWPDLQEEFAIVVLPKEVAR